MASDKRSGARKFAWGTLSVNATGTYTDREAPTRQLENALAGGLGIGPVTQCRYLGCKRQLRAGGGRPETVTGAVPPTVTKMSADALIEWHDGGVGLLSRCVSIPQRLARARFPWRPCCTRIPEPRMVDADAADSHHSGVNRFHWSRSSRVQWRMACGGDRQARASRRPQASCRLGSWKRR